MTVTVLQEAAVLIDGERQETYGDASVSFNRIAGLWSAYLGAEVTGLDVANMMVLLKVSRTKGTFHRDSYVDIAGYAALGEQLYIEAQKSDVIDAEVTEEAPRQWDSLYYVPRNVKVQDKDGDIYQFENDGWNWEGISLTDQEVREGYNCFAPFTEVIS